MKTVFIGGWATGEDVWRSVVPMVENCSYLPWQRVLTGNYVLPDRCILAGWSLGGQLAMEMSRYPQVRGLVLVSSMSCLAKKGTRPGVEPEKLQEIETMLARSRRGYLRRFFRECGAGNHILEELLGGTGDFTGEELVSGLRHMFLTEAKPRMDIPAVVIHGTRDRIVPCEAADYLAGNLLPGARRVTVTRGGHLLPLSSPDVIGKAVNSLADNPAA